MIRKIIPSVIDLLSQMTYWACTEWCFTKNLQSFQVSCRVNIQTSTHPANERRINVQYCIMSTSCVMTAGYFLFERMPEWGYGLQSINSWCDLRLTQHTKGFLKHGCPSFCFSIMEPLSGPKILKWTRRSYVSRKTHNDKIWTVTDNSYWRGWQGFCTPTFSITKCCNETQNLIKVMKSQDKQHNHSTIHTTSSACLC